MFSIRLFPYVLSIWSPRVRAVVSGAAVPAARAALTTKKIARTDPCSLTPEWPCLEDCKNIEEKIARIKTLFLGRGGDINQKHPITKKSALYEIFTFHHDLEELRKLSRLFFQHGAKIDPSEYNDESPFSHIFYTSKLEKDALAKITILAKLGVSLQIKNVRGETLLQTAEKIQLSPAGIAKIRALMKEQTVSHTCLKKA